MINIMEYTKRQKIGEIVEVLVEEMGGDALEICSGDCAVFACRLIDILKEGVIVDNLSDCMKDEIEDYETIEPEYELGISHCYIKVDDLFFDAFDTYGTDEESEMMYHNECYVA